ncbi:hypothetical protein RJ639_036948, partial [Escallonia herrerae]
MTKISKRQALGGGVKDKISNLPRNLTDRILELMPIRDAARTSILSRNWRYDWATQPQLVLDKNFLRDIIFNKRLLHRSLLHKRLNGIMDLTLANSSAHPYKLPSYIYSYQELRHLKLSKCIYKPPRMFVGFHNLSILHLKKISFVVNRFKNFPLLEDITFVTCLGVRNLHISAPKLRSFTAIDTQDVGWSSFMISSNLTLVNIAHCRMGHYGQGERLNLVKLVGCLPAIVNLSLDGLFLKILAIGAIPRRLPTMVTCLKFLSLSNLQFTELDHVSCVLCLLRSSLNLERLEVSTATGSSMESVVSYLEAPDCLDQTLDKLRTVNMKFMGSRAELLLIKLLLAHSPSLEKVSIEQSGVVDAYEGFKVSRELMRFSRASPRAEIIFLEPLQQIF